MKFRTDFGILLTQNRIKLRNRVYGAGFGDFAHPKSDKVEKPRVAPDCCGIFFGIESKIDKMSSSPRVHLSWGGTSPPPMTKAWALGGVVFVSESFVTKHGEKDCEG